MSGAVGGAVAFEVPGVPGTPRGWGRRVVRWAADTVLVVVCALCGLVFLGLELDPASGPRVRGDAALVADVLLGLPATLALYARRRAPVLVAGVLVAVSVVSGFAAVPCLVALFGVAVRRRWPAVAALGAATVLVGVVYGLLWPDPEFPQWLLVLFLLALVVPVAGWGMYVRTRHQLVASLREQAETARAEQELRVQRARATERARIAREMHDVLAHRLSLVSMHAGALEFRPGAPAEDVARAAGVIRAGTHEALEDLRDILGVLRADAAAPGGEEVSGRPQPTLDDVPALVEEARAAGADVDLHLGVPDGARPPALAGRTAYRVVQEGMTNARKHAAGRPVRVLVDGAPGTGLEVSVVDDGAAAALAPSPGAAVPGAGLGLVGLAERVALAGGELEHGRTGGGYRLRARLPWPA
ncbi:sensor histidine kinase [Kineococcus esterisolvens]|uniref:sensor histidine kinase n=1 Tax=unclassified Kineococcus TaxID=2621656 RepID=UPI003D7E5867